MQLMVFSKHLVGLPLDEVARRLKAMNIDAIDLTVRPGGHVEPERVEDELPRAATVLGQGGVRIGMITTGITDAHDPLTSKVLRTAAQLGIHYYKLGYYTYQGFGTLRKQRLDVSAKLRDLATLNREVVIHGGFHNHSANLFGASLWDVAHVLQDTDPAVLGVYFDAAHATVEGGGQGWLMALDLIIDRITMLAVKDFQWVEGAFYAGARRNRPQWCPLADGTTPWPQVLQHLHSAGFHGPVSLHSEYQGKESFQDLSVDEVFEQTALDADVFRSWMKK
ncbi:MAG: sugar phosphate isomerase/epimerase [Abitibacteriaceae bacterium]|nr:sugar phosphate isomerase/epimerase [Abditibacteriaceae bacterium]